MTEAGDGFRQELASLVFAEEESNRRQVVNVGRKWGMSKQASGPQDTAEEGCAAAQDLAASSPAHRLCPLSPRSAIIELHVGMLALCIV